MNLLRDGLRRWARAGVASTVLAAIAMAVPAAGGEPSRDSQREVYTIDPWVDGVLIAASALGSGAAYALQSQLIHERCPCSPSEVNAFDRSVIGNHSALADHLSDASIGAIVVAPIVFDLGALGLGPAFRQDAVVYAEVLALNQAAVTIVKYAVQRPIPRTYAGDPTVLHSAEGYRSFYSGHVSTAFAALTAAATTASLRYETGAWPWMAAGVLGTSVAAERVLAGRHFYTDVMVGAVAGTAFGIGVPLLHRRQRGSPRLGAMPVRGGAGLELAGQF